MSLLSDKYINNIENNYYLLRFNYKQSQKNKIILNDNQKKMIESFCDKHISVILKNRIVRSTTTICLFICEYLQNNSNLNVLYRGGYWYGSTIGTIKDFIEGILHVNIIKSNANELKLINGSRISEYPTHISGFKPDLIYLSDMDGLDDKELEKIFDDLLQLWDFGIKPKIIMEHSILMKTNNKFYKFYTKSKNNYYVNIVDVINK